MVQRAMSDINHSRMIPLHIADQAVAACEKEIAGLKARLTDCKAEADRLKAEVERLRSSSFVTAVPVEQYERVIKAGDALHKAMLECGPNEMAEEFDHDRWWASYYGWQAAKETPPHA